MEGEVFGDRVSVSHGEMLIHTELSLEVRLGVGIGFELKSRPSSAKKNYHQPFLEAAQFDPT